MIGEGDEAQRCFADEGHSAVVADTLAEDGGHAATCWADGK